jgi:hypothetical protein
VDVCLETDDAVRLFPDNLGAPVPHHKRTKVAEQVSPLGARLLSPRIREFRSTKRFLAETAGLRAPRNWVNLWQYVVCPTRIASFKADIEELWKRERKRTDLFNRP